MLKRKKVLKPLQKKVPVVNIRILDLPKISLNDWYAGTHWTKRKKIKDVYSLMVDNVYDKHITYPCVCEYSFGFLRNPLDASNCVAMVKMIEDCIFPDDGCKVVKSVTISSCRADANYVELKIKAL